MYLRSIPIWVELFYLCGRASESFTYLNFISLHACALHTYRMQTKSNAVCAGTWCESYSKGELGMIKLKKNLHYLPTDLPITFHHPSIQLPASSQMIGKLIGKIFLLNPGLSLYMALIFKRPTPNKTYQSMLCFLSFQANRTNKLVGWWHRLYL